MCVRVGVRVCMHICLSVCHGQCCAAFNCKSQFYTCSFASVTQTDKLVSEIAGSPNASEPICPQEVPHGRKSWHRAKAQCMLSVGSASCKPNSPSGQSAPSGAFPQPEPKGWVRKHFRFKVSVGFSLGHTGGAQGFTPGSVLKKLLVGLGGR